MSAQEFAEWHVYYQVEGLTPQARRGRRAVRKAAQANGPLTRKDKRLWRAEDFAEVDPWSAVAQPPAPPPTPAKHVSPAAQMKALHNARNRR